MWSWWVGCAEPEPGGPGPTEPPPAHSSAPPHSGVVAHSATPHSADPGPFGLTFVDRGLVYEAVEDIPPYGPVVVPLSDVSVREQGGELVLTCTVPDFTRLGAPTRIQYGALDADDQVTTRAPVLTGDDRATRHAFEGSELVLDGGRTWIFASSYPAAAFGDPAPGYPADLGLYELVGDTATAVAEPVLARTPHGPDQDAVYSPSVTRFEGRWWMAYAAHCFPRIGAACPLVPGGVSLRWAVADDLQGPWEVLDEASAPVAEPLPAWAGAFVAEPSLAVIDDTLVVFVTGFVDESPVSLGWGRVVGGALAWDPVPAVTLGSSGAALVVAPSALVDADGVRLWYTWLGEDGVQRLGRADGSFTRDGR